MGKANQRSAAIDGSAVLQIKGHRAKDDSQSPMACRGLIPEASAPLCSSASTVRIAHPAGAVLVSAGELPPRAGRSQIGQFRCRGRKVATDHSAARLQPIELTPGNAPTGRIKNAHSVDGMRLFTVQRPQRNENRSGCLILRGIKALPGLRPQKPEA